MHSGDPDKIRYKGKGIREKQRYQAKNCPWQLRLNYDAKTNIYLIKHIFNDHNNTHPLTEVFYQSHPKQRKLNEEEKETVIQMINAKAKPAVIVESIKNKTGKIITTKDVNNIKQSVNKEILPQISEITNISNDIELNDNSILRFNQQLTQAVMSNATKCKERLLLLENLAKLWQDDIDVQIIPINF